MELQWSCNGVAMELQWSCNGGFLSFLRRCNGVAMELQWSCNGVAMELQWGCNGVAIFCNSFAILCNFESLCLCLSLSIATAKEKFVSHWGCRLQPTSLQPSARWGCSRHRFTPQTVASPFPGLRCCVRAFPSLPCCRTTGSSHPSAILSLFSLPGTPSFHL